MGACCRHLEYAKKELTNYLKLYKEKTFNEFINIYRVEDFKELIANKENEIYDIHSISEMAGFKSRATFYRVFKEAEGITPTQYKNNLNG